MAKFTATAVVFCLFAAALALNPPEKDDDATTTVALPFSDGVNPLIRLPSDTVKGKNSDAAAKPLIEDTFRPINRRFYVRRSKHVCSHHLVDPTVRGNVEIPYGNDMLVSSGENSDFNHDSEMIRGGGRQRVKLHHHHHHHHHHKDDNTDSDSDSDSDSDDDVNGDDRISKKSVHKRYDHHRFDRKKLKELKKIRENFRFQKEMEEKHKNSGFMNRVRKFLDHYF